MLATSERGQNEFRWRGGIPAGQVIEVKGIMGDVRAEPASGAEVEVVATKRARKSEPDEVELQVLQHEDGITVCALYPEGWTQYGRRRRDNDGPNYCAPGEEGRMNTSNNDVHVDFVVRVPRGVIFVGRTVNGSVRAESLSSDVDLYTVNGDVEVSTTGEAQAVTVNGDIRATLRGRRWKQPLDFRTVNGTVTVQLPADASTKVHAEVQNGRVYSDFPLETRERWGRRRMQGTIGAGEGEIYLGTLNGRLRIERIDR